MYLFRAVLRFLLFFLCLNIFNFNVTQASIDKYKLSSLAIDLTDKNEDIKKPEQKIESDTKQTEVQVSLINNFKLTHGIENNWQALTREIVWRNKKGLKNILVEMSKRYKQKEKKLDHYDEVNNVMAKSRAHVKIEQKSASEVTSIHDMAQRELSSSVSDVIQRELSKYPSLTSKQDKTSKKDNDLVVGQSKLLIRTKHSVINQGIIEGKNFDVRFIHNQKQISDYGMGEVEFSESLKGDSTIMLKVLKQGNLVTNVEVNLKENGSNEVDIPLLDVDTTYRYANKKQINDYGGYLLVKLSEQTTEIEIDSSSSARLLLTEDMHVVDDIDQANYVLYMGIKPGNIGVTQLITNGYIAKNIINIIDNEVTYLKLDSKHILNEQVIIYEEDLIQKKPGKLYLDEEFAWHFNSDKRLKKTSPGRFIKNDYYKMPTIRDYVLLKHLANNIYLGGKGKVIGRVPSQNYLDEMLKKMDINSLNQNCVIQVNLTDKIVKANIDGSSYDKGIYLDQYALDTDGLISSEFGPMTDKIFLKGYADSVVSIAVEYLDGQKSIIKSFCSLGTYLVEQL